MPRYRPVPLRRAFQFQIDFTSAASAPMVTAKPAKSTARITLTRWCWRVVQMLCARPIPAHQPSGKPRDYKRFETQARHHALPLWPGFLRKSDSRQR
jgi:hypothetical protein